MTMTKEDTSLAKHRKHQTARADCTKRIFKMLVILISSSFLFLSLFVCLLLYISIYFIKCGLSAYVVRAAARWGCFSTGYAGVGGGWR